MDKFKSYIKLARLDKPVGIYLLLWPSLIGLMLGILESSLFELKSFLIVLIGSILVRSCGCVINDISDHKFDKLVARTKDRPLASGEISLKEAWMFFFSTAAACFSLLIFVPKITLYISIIIAVFIIT